MSCVLLAIFDGASLTELFTTRERRHSLEVFPVPYPGRALSVWYFCDTVLLCACVF